MRIAKALVAMLVIGGVTLGCADKETRVVQGVGIAEDEAGLWAKATLPADSAMRVALARVPGGKDTKAELEEENDRLIYSFEIATAAKEGVDEVHVDARTGEVVKAEHEKE
jgi:uncharacterized membrane protein YkoI